MVFFAPPLLLADAEVSLAPATSAGSYVLDFSDRDNAAWLFQSSTDLVTWTTRRTFQANNTGHRFAIDATASGPPVFFRMEAAPSSTPAADSRSERTTLPVVADNYAVLTLPARLPAPNIRAQDNTPATNRVTSAGATLGRVLF